MTKAKPKASTKPTVTASPARNKPTGDQTKAATIKEVSMQVTTKVSGMALRFDDVMKEGKTKVADGLQLITAAVAMRNLEPIQLREVFDYSASLVDAVDEAKKLARGRVLELAERVGEHTGTNNRSLKLTFEDGKSILCKAMKTGTDPKKFEAALRAKGKDVTEYMVPDIKYKLSSDYDSVQKAIDDGVFTQDEAALFDYEISYAVERSKEGKAE